MLFRKPARAGAILARSAPPRCSPPRPRRSMKSQWPWPFRPASTARLSLAAEALGLFKEANLSVKTIVFRAPAPCCPRWLPSA